MVGTTHNGISGCGSTVLPALYSAWIAKEIIKNLQEVLHEPIEYDQDSSWLENYWDKVINEAIIPEISTSSELRHATKKIKKT